MSDAIKLPVASGAVPSLSFEAIERLAVSVAKSGLFGIRTPDQALTLMMIAQAEGRHPALAARDYHIIQGAPAKKAEAMLRDFLGAGGHVEWHELSDEAAEATFSHPAGGSARIRWDAARVKRAELNNPMHRKYPRQMLRSRVVSEGVRTVWPMATSGMYVPEEVVEFGPRRDAEPIDVTPKAELDNFAASALDTDALRLKAEQAATDGTEAFREWWKTLGHDERAALKPDLAQYQRVAQDADAQHAADRDHDDDPFGLPPSPPEAPAERPDAGDPAPVVAHQGAPFAERFAALSPPRHDDGTADWVSYSISAIDLITEAHCVAREELAVYAFARDPRMQELRRTDGDLYRRIMDAVKAA